MGIKHAFVSAIADGADATLVRPSNWNADHTGLVVENPGNVWAALTPVALGYRIARAGVNLSFLIWEVTQAGTTGAVEPNWEAVPLASGPITDATVQWTFRGYVGKVLGGALSIEAAPDASGNTGSSMITEDATATEAGDLYIRGGHGASGKSGGIVGIQGGKGDAGAMGGATFYVGGGSGAGFNAGYVAATGGTSSSGHLGARFEAYGGTEDDGGVGGNGYLVGGNPGSAGHKGGFVQVLGGTGLEADGGLVDVVGGTGSGAGNGGVATLRGGNGTIGANVVIRGGVSSVGGGGIDGSIIMSGLQANLTINALAFNLLAGTVDPSAGAGIAANILSIYLRDNAGVGELWFKTGAADTAWTQVI